MQAGRSSKSRPDPPYKRLGENICTTGVQAMAPCPQCRKAGVTCFVRKGNKRCGPCTKKNMTCDGSFSQAVFDNLEAKKQELRQRSRVGRKLMRTFAKQLLLHEKEQAKLEGQLDEISRRQNAMVDREARALGEMNEVDADSSPEPVEMALEDDFFLNDDPSRLGEGLSVEANDRAAVAVPSDPDFVWDEGMETALLEWGAAPSSLGDTPQ